MAYIYEKEILEAGIVNVIPDYAPLSEAYFYLQEATENDWNALKREIGIYELGVLEATGSEIIYEENDEAKSSIKERFLKFVEGVWARIKGLFDRAMKTIDSFATSAKAKFNSAFKNHVVANLKLMDDDKIKAKVHATVHNYKGLANATVKKEDFDKDAFVNELKGDSVEVTKTWLMSGNNLDTLIKGAVDFKFTKGQLGTSYKSAKQEVDKKLKEAKASKDNPNIDAAKTELSNINKSAAAIVSVFQARQREYAKTLASLALLAGKQVAVDKKADRAAKAEQKKAEKEEAKKVEKKEEVQQNSAEMEGTPIIESYSTEVEKLFNWNF